jgi:type I restriction enzyme, S subunit
MSTSTLRRTKVVPLGELIPNVKPGFAVGERDAEGVIQIRMNNVDLEGNLDLEGIIRVPATSKQVSDCSLEAGDVLFNNTNSTELVGKSALFRGHSEPVTFSNHFTRLRVNREQLEPRYLARWLTRQQHQRVFEGLCTRWVGQSAVRTEKLLALAIPLPPLPEQKRIADILDKADAIRRKRREAATSLRDFIRSLFDASFGQPLSNPKRWPIRTLEEVIAPDTSVSYGIVQCGPHVPDGVPFIRTSDITVEQLPALETLGRTSLEIASRFRRSAVRPGDLVFANRASIGAVIAVPDYLDGANLTQGTTRIAPGPDVGTDYLLWLFRSHQMQKWLDQAAKGITFREITMAKLREAPIPVPPKALQADFAKQVFRASAGEATLKRAADEADDLFNSLVHRAFKGEL